MDNHELEIRELEERAFNLHSEATATSHIKTKERLIDEESAIRLKIEHLKSLQNESLETEYAQKNQTQIIENRAFILFSVNGQRIEIDKNGNVELEYKQCGHKKTMQISELQLHTHQNNRMKFETWRRLLKEHITYNGSMSCSQCRENKTKKFKLLRRYDNNPVPRLFWELRALR